MEHRLRISSVVSRPDGNLFYQDSHDWGGLSDEMLTWFTKKLAEATTKAHEHHTKFKGEDDANLTATFTMEVDGSKVPSVVQSGVSYRTVLEQEKHMMGIFKELLDAAEKVQAPKHKAKKGK